MADVAIIDTIVLVGVLALVAVGLAAARRRRRNAEKPPPEDDPGW